jgi:GNAT superfamily N-acetyltransferase
MHLNGAVLLRAAANCANAYRAWAERMGRPARLWDDLSCGDLGLAASLPPNNATLLRPATAASLGGVLERVTDFFAGGTGGGFEIWSLWPLPADAPPGYEERPVPCMVRDRGGEPPPPPLELEIVEADDASTVLEAEALIGEVFEVDGEPGSTLRPQCLGEDFRVWVGRVDGRPVTTATAFIADGFVGIYAVATLRDARRRGYAEAVTWAATLCRPDLPATLQASEMGQPVYERMGYRTVAEFTVWERDRR